jgi:excinuclease ABC subunit C
VDVPRQSSGSPRALARPPAPPLLSGPRASAARLPPGPGVYRFRDAAGRVLYVGRAVSLRRRVTSYWGDLGDRGHLAAMVARIARVEAVPCDSAHEAAWLERNLLETRKPPWNRSPSGGQEAEVWIRLSESAPVCGLRVVHQPRPGDPARYFGPYLGGQKARDAVSGLRRMLPLGYAADRFAGAERDLALARGAWSQTPASLAAAVAAVLDREPAAVTALRAGMTARRDAAAARLAFEFAGRLQAELEAVDWVTAEQKVTQAQPSDLDVAGWADGVLVCFAIRGGRLCRWSQRACSAAAARRHLAGPPEPGPWADFARRSAELAARLRLPPGRTGGALALTAGPNWRRACAYRRAGLASPYSAGWVKWNACVKLYQLPESSRMIASMP